MSAKRHRVFTDDEYDLLTDEERAKFAHLANDAYTFETTFMFSIVGAFIVCAVASLADMVQLSIIAGICFVSFIVIIWVGSDWHHRRFNKKLFEAIDKHKNGTS